MKALQRTLRGVVLVSVLTAHTSVGSAASFAIQGIQATTNGGFAISWSTVPGRTDQVMYTDSPGDPWLPGALHAAGSSQITLCYTDYPPANVTQRFYRIKGQRKVVMSLVLDRSGSMGGNGGAQLLVPAVSNFIDLFDDQNDRAAMISFSYAASTDVTARQPFKQDIKNAVNNLVFSGWTCSERGLTNALAQNSSVILLPGENVVRVIVFFTDGMANTWYYNFNCGPRNISPDGHLWNPNTGNLDESGCTKPATIPSINGGPDVDTFSCVSMNTEAQERAEWIGHLARSQGNYIYAIGMGDQNQPGECGGAFPVLNPEFLKNLANSPDSQTYDPSQPVGGYAIAANAGELDQVFQAIAAGIFSQSP